MRIACPARQHIIEDILTDISERAPSRKPLIHFHVSGLENFDSHTTTGAGDNGATNWYCLEGSAIIYAADGIQKNK
jgi:hypothetical protein